MSYLPRMSKTYKEPEERTQDEPAKEITFNSIPIASAQPDEKAYNPQSVLKQYNYYPHPPPMLPGPSLIREAEENEKLTVEAKRRRSKDENEAINTFEIENIEEFPFDSSNKKRSVNFALVEVKPAKLHYEQSAPDVYKASKSNKVSKKGSLKVNKSKEETIKAEKFPVNDVIAEIESKSPPNPKKKDASHANEATSHGMSETPIRHRSNNLKIKSDHKIHQGPLLDNTDDNILSVNPGKGSVHEGVQCTPTSATEKVFVMPLCIHHLVRTLSFLVQELERHETDGKPGPKKEIKKLITQIDEAAKSLSNRKIEGAIALQTSLSDQKRLEKIYSELEQYIQYVYGENGKLGRKSEERKRLYCKLFQKDYELSVLNEKLRESEIQNPCLKQVEPMTKPPEVVLQNKNLENEQLRAEVEFNSQEMKKFHESLAEKNWEIHKNKEDILALKKKLASLKSKKKI